MPIAIGLNPYTGAAKDNYHPDANGNMVYVDPIYGYQGPAITGVDGKTYGGGGGPAYGPSGGNAPSGAPGGSMTSLATGGGVAGGGAYSGNAQLDQVRDEFRRMKERSLGGINEDLAARGIFSSGVGAKIAGDASTQIDLEQGAAIERIMNDILGRNQNYALDQMRLQNQMNANLYGGGSRRYGNANQNQDIMAMFQQMMAGQGGGGAIRYGGPQGYKSSLAGGGYGGMATGDPNALPSTPDVPGSVGNPFDAFGISGSGGESLSDFYRKMFGG